MGFCADPSCRFFLLAHFRVLNRARFTRSLVRGHPCTIRYSARFARSRFFTDPSPRTLKSAQDWKLTPHANPTPSNPFCAARSAGAYRVQFGLSYVGSHRQHFSDPCLITPCSLRPPPPRALDLLICYPGRHPSSRIRTYFRLFLQEQRAIDSGSTFPAPSTPVPIGTGGTSTSAGGAWSGVPAGSVAQNIGSSGSGGGGGGIETLKAFLTSGGTGAGSGSGGGSGGGTAGGTAGTAGAGGVSAMGSAGELGLGRFLLSSKRYRSTRSRSATFVWSNNGVWKVSVLFVLLFEG